MQERNEPRTKMANERSRSSLRASSPEHVAERGRAGPGALRRGVRQDETEELKRD